MSGWSDPDTLQAMADQEKADRQRYGDAMWEHTVATFNAYAKSSDMQQAAMGRMLQRCLPSLEEFRRAIRDKDSARGSPLLLGSVDGLATALAALLLIVRSTGADVEEGLKQRFTNTTETTLAISQVAKAVVNAHRGKP